MPTHQVRLQSLSLVGLEHTSDGWVLSSPLMNDRNGPEARKIPTCLPASSMQTHVLLLESAVLKYKPQQPSQCTAQPPLPRTALTLQKATPGHAWRRAPWII